MFGAGTRSRIPLLSREGDFRKVSLYGFYPYLLLVREISPDQNPANVPFLKSLRMEIGFIEGVIPKKIPVDSHQSRYTLHNPESKEEQEGSHASRYHKPEPRATKPNQVWSWNITKPSGSRKWPATREPLFMRDLEESMKAFEASDAEAARGTGE